MNTMYYNAVKIANYFLQRAAMLALQALYKLQQFRPSVRLSVTRRQCVKTTARSTVQFALWGTSLSVQDSFGTYTFGTCFFGTATFGTLNVSIGAVTFGTYKISVQSTSVHKCQCTKVLMNRSQETAHCDL